MILNQPHPALSRLSAAVMLACGGVLAAGPAQAQQPGAVQRIEITGSNIKRTDLETASPVQIVTREEISRSGAGSIRELIDVLPAATPSLSDIGGSNSFASGASSASLRNLGKTSTLILLNGRRVSPYALADFNEVFTNIDTLPIEAVERVEILKSGASAIYGSDAVAGVINVITRSSFQGLLVSGGSEKSLRSNRFDTSNAGITFGFGNLDKDKFNLFGNVEVYQREGVIWRDILQYMHPVTFRRIPQTFAAQASTFSYPGNVVGAGPVPGCAAELVISNLCRHDRYSRFEAQPGAKRANLLLSANFQFSPTLTGFAELLYAKTETTYVSPFPIYGNINTAGVTTWGNPLTNKGQSFVYRGLGAQHPLNQVLRADDVDFRYRFVDSGQESSPESTDHRLQFGLRGVAGAWDWETGLGFLGSKVDDIGRGTFSNSGFIALIGDYNLDPLPADFFNKANGYKIGQPNSPEVINRLFPEFGTVGKTTQVVLDGKVSGQFGRLGAAPIGVALGFDLRRERFTIDPTDNLRQGDIVGFGLSSTEGSRTYGAAFAEVSLKPVQSLELQLAARADKYPNLSTNISPKLAARFEPVRGFVLRGAAETGFRAPNLTETAQSVKFAFNNGVRDPKRCNQAEQLAADLEARAANAPEAEAAVLLARADSVVSNECSGGVAAIVGNNPSLKPEKSQGFNLGLAVEPTPGVNISVDYWKIKRKDEIDLRGATELLSIEGQPLPTGSSISRDALTLDPTFSAAERAQYGVSVGALNSITRSFENLSRTTTSGVDVAVNIKQALAGGTLTVDLVGTYLTDLRRFSPVRNGYGDNLAGRWTYPRISASLTTAYATKNWTHGLKARHTTATSLQGDFFDTGWSTAECATRRPIAVSEGECRVAPITYFDYFVQFKRIKDLTLGAYVRNVFNKLPPPDLRDLAQNGSNIIPQSRGDAQGRTLRLTLQYRFF